MKNEIKKVNDEKSSFLSDFFGEQALDFFGGFEKRFNSIFNDFDNFGFLSSKEHFPKVDIKEYDQYYEIEAHLAGMKKENIEIKKYFKGDRNILFVSGKHEEKTENNDDFKFVHKELKSSFKRSFVMAANADLDKISAKFDNGVLLISIPKKEIVLTQEKEYQVVKID